MATNAPATLSKSTGGGGTNWGSILATYGPAALEALSSYSAGRANNRATDAQIDALVYALYGLTEEEIAVVEGTAVHE